MGTSGSSDRLDEPRRIAPGAVAFEHVRASSYDSRRSAGVVSRVPESRASGVRPRAANMSWARPGQVHLTGLQFRVGFATQAGPGVSILASLSPPVLLRFVKPSPGQPVTARAWV